MKELEKMAIEELIKVYTQYTQKKKINEELTKNAKRVYNEYTPGFRFINSDINGAVAELFAIAYPRVDPERKTPTIQKAKEIVEKLKEVKKNLSKK